MSYTESRPSPHPNLMYLPGGQLALTPEAHNRIRRINSEGSKAYDKGIADGTIKPYVHVTEDQRRERFKAMRARPRRRS